MAETPLKLGLDRLVAWRVSYPDPAVRRQRIDYLFGQMCTQIEGVHAGSLTPRQALVVVEALNDEYSGLDELLHGKRYSATPDDVRRNQVYAYLGGLIEAHEGLPLDRWLALRGKLDAGMPVTVEDVERREYIACYVEAGILSGTFYTREVKSRRAGV